MTFIERPRENEKNRALSYIAKLLDEARSNKDARIEDITALEEIQKLLSAKRYGLVWEQHVEKFEEDMKTVIPIFYEDVSRKINDDRDSEDFNFLLEGDNLHSLHLLEKTHKGNIDVIYIDPPYNTRKKDFRYNDDFVDPLNSFSHSKWLSFMNNRLSLAKKTLSKTGIIFVSIDDREQSQLRLLMDEIFGRTNFIGTLIWRKKSGGGQTDNYFVTEHEYILCYQSSPQFRWKNAFEELGVNSRNIDEKGEYTLTKLEKWGNTAHREDRPTMYFPIIDPDGKNFFPIAPDGKDGRWRVGKLKMENLLKDNCVLWKKKNGRWTPYEKKYVEGKRIKLIKSRSIIYNLAETGNGTKMLTSLFGEKDKFENPKPVELIKFLLSHTSKDAVVLDFFAGSGTTGQAVVELNQEDSGNRKFILATNNENKIAEEVTYERMKRVSSGTDEYEAHPMNFKYFKTDFIHKQADELENSLLNNVKTLIELKHGIDLDDSDVAIVTKRSDIKELDVLHLSTIYMRSQTHKMLDRKQLEDLKGIKIIDIPETFFPLEMKEAGL